MRSVELTELLEETPVIAAVKDREGLDRSLCCSSRVIFVLYGDILTIGDEIERIKAAGKTAIVHVDLIDGLSPREVAVDFIGRHTRADGIITTKTPLVRYAKSAGLLAIQRFFLLDSIALENIHKQLTAGGADCIEILPGVMPKVIGRLTGTISCPVIAGGLISDKEDVVGALSAGAIAVSSTNPQIWNL